MSKLNHSLQNHDFQTYANIKLQGFEMGELYVQYVESESYHFVDETLKSANQNISQGFGLRQIKGEEQTYFYSTDLEDIDRNKNQTSSQPLISKQKFYSDFFYLDQIESEKKIKLLQDINDYVRQSSNLVSQVSVNLTGQWEEVKIFMKDLEPVKDIRPMVRLNIAVNVKRGDRIEKGSYGTGGRFDYSNFFVKENWQAYADQALDQALINLEAVECPAGKMKLVLGNGWPGVLLHEAIGHGLEADAHRKKTSVFTELMGKSIADSQVTVIDSGIIDQRRGSLNVDDEGTPTQENVLIENGKLVKLMTDKFNAKLMGEMPTGNGRRQSFQHIPMPRMTNTYMIGGKYSPEEIIESVDHGIFASYFSGGQVDITSGKFVFSASEAYLIENGKITQPVKGATLIGDGAEALKKIKMVGNDMALDEGIGTCGKNGQSVPVGVGQPTLRIDGLTIGGTKI